VLYEVHEATPGQLANNPSGLARAAPGASYSSGYHASIHVATMSRRAAASPGKSLQILANFRDMLAGINDREYRIKLLIVLQLFLLFSPWNCI
jgi:hypothetical protein